MLMERDPEVDWKRVLLDFVRWGWKLKAVALAINVPYSTLMGWWNDGAEPRFEDGRALLKLHAWAKTRNSESSDAEPGLQPAR